MNVRVLLFGQLKDIMGESAIVLNAVPDTERLIDEIKSIYPAMNTARFIIAVDKKVVSENTILTDNCTVALLPPFSGG